MDREFWMVLVDGTGSCSQKHDSLKVAKTEAERLVRLPHNMDKGATILEAVEYCKIEYPPVSWVTFGMSFEEAAMEYCREAGWREPR